MTDERLGDGLWAALERLPKGSGVVFRHYGLAPAERRALFEEMVARMYEHGKAVNTASHFEIDDVIDPLDSRRWITAGLRAAPRRPPSPHKRRPSIDTW